MTAARTLLTFLFFHLLLAACSSGRFVAPPPSPEPVLPQVVRQLEISDTITLGLVDTLAGWSTSRDAPEFLVEEFVHHVEHELADKGQERTRAEMEDIVRRRLASNELYIFRPASSAWIAIDFSALRNGEAKPDRKMVFNSARYAGVSLANEEGVANVHSRVSGVHVEGADYAFRLDADYLLHGRPRKFAGLIGFSDPFWFYIYYTDPLNDPGDYAVIDDLLDHITILSPVQ